MLGRTQEALAIIDRAVRVDPANPANVWPPTARAIILIGLGRLDEAERALQSTEAAAKPLRDFGAMWRQIRFALAVAQRDTANSETLAREVVASALDTRADASIVLNAASFAAAPLVRMGRRDDAMRILLRSVDAGVAPDYDWLLTDPDVQRLRGDPRFPGVLAESRKTAAMFAGILGQARARGELPDYLHAPLDDLVKLLKENDGEK